MEGVDNNDHDLLIELRTEMRGMREDVKRMNDTSTKEIAESKAEINKLRIEVDTLKSQQLLWKGGLIVAVAICIPLIVYIWKTTPQVKTEDVSKAVAESVASVMAKYEPPEIINKK